MSLMQAIHDYYTQKDTMITRANAIRSDQAMGDGVYLSWADREQITPDSSYDYMRAVQNIVEQGQQWRDMFGFVAYTSPVKMTQGELERLQDAHIPTPEEIAEQRIAECCERIETILGSKVPEEQEQEQGKDDDADSEQVGTHRVQQSAMEEQRRVNIGVPTVSDEIAGKRAERQVFNDMLGKQLRPKETKLRNGNALTASDSVLQFVDKMDSQKKKSRATRAKSQRRMELSDMLIEIENVKIIDIDAGSFYLQVDEVTCDKKIVWVPKRRETSNMVATAGIGGGMHSRHRLRFVDFDPNVYVFVWPGRMPSRDGIIQSEFIELMRLRERMLEAEDNMMHADYQCTHPIPIVQQGKALNKVDISSLPEQDSYGVAMCDGPDDILNRETMTPTEIGGYNRDMRSAVMLEMSVAASQSVQLGERAKAFRAGLARATRGTRGGLSVPEMRSSMLDSGVFHLPNGLMYAGIVQPKPVASTLELRDVYDTRLAIALGVPKNYLTGQQAGGNASNSTGASAQNSAKGKSSNSSSIIESMMRTTIMRDRTEACRFFDEMYNNLFRLRDNSLFRDKLTRVLRAKDMAESITDAYLRSASERYLVTKQLASVEDSLASLISESSRVLKMEEDLERVISLKFRLQLKFVKSPFVNNDEIRAMYEQGAVSRAEMVNIMRQNIGLEKVDDDEVQRIYSENLQRQSEETKTMAEAQCVPQKDITTTTTKSDSPPDAEGNQSAPMTSVSTVEKTTGPRSSGGTGRRRPATERKRKRDEKPTTAAKASKK